MANRPQKRQMWLAVALTALLVLTTWTPSLSLHALEPEEGPLPESGLAQSSSLEEVPSEASQPPETTGDPSASIDSASSNSTSADSQSMPSESSSEATSSSETSEAHPAEAPELIRVMLPCDVTFGILVFEGLNQGIISSEEYALRNDSEMPIEVEVTDITLNIEGAGVYTVLTTDEFLKEESSIFVEMLCADDYGEAATVLTAYPGTGQYTYRLAPGAEGRFSFQGKVSEYEALWGDANVSVSLCFSFIESAPLPPTPDSLESDESPENGDAASLV